MENSDRAYNYFRFEDLRVYHKSLDLINWVYNNTSISHTLPQSEVYVSLIKASTSIAVSIAEGSGKSKNQFIYYLQTAASAARECIVLDSICLNESFFSQEQHDECRNILIEISKMVGALISSLQRSKRSEHDADDITNSTIDNND